MNAEKTESPIRPEEKSSMITSHYFTFGSRHMTNFPLPNGGIIADYWIRVDLPKDSTAHRAMFIEHFTARHCPTKDQFSFEYTMENFQPGFFPGGELAVITEDGLVK